MYCVKVPVRVSAQFSYLKLNIGLLFLPASAAVEEIQRFAVVKRAQNPNSILNDLCHRHDILYLKLHCNSKHCRLQVVSFTVRAFTGRKITTLRMHIAASAVIEPYGRCDMKVLIRSVPRTPSVLLVATLEVRDLIGADPYRPIFLLSVLIGVLKTADQMT